MAISLVVFGDRESKDDGSLGDGSRLFCPDTDRPESGSDAVENWLLNK